MSLIPSMPISEFKRLKAGEIKEMQSVEVTSDGEVLFTAIIPPVNAGMTMVDTIRTEAEYLGVRGNSVGGKTPAELREPVGV